MSNKKISQFDPGLVLKDVHERSGSYLRTKESLSLVTDFYDYFIPTYDSEGRPTQVDYYVGTSPHITELTITQTPDPSGYLSIYSAKDKERYILYFTVDGSGSGPGISGTTEIEVPLLSSDSLSIIAGAIRVALESTGEFEVSQANNVLIVKTEELGLTTPTSETNTYITVTNTDGDQELIKTIILEYSADGYPIWNDQELKDYKYNMFTGQFEATGDMTRALNNLECAVLARLDDGNTSTTPLTDGSTFVGEWTERCSQTILVGPYADTDFTFYVQYASSQIPNSTPINGDFSDGIEASIEYNYTAGVTLPIPRRLIISRQWYRVVAVNNSGTDMTQFSLQTSIGDFDEPVIRLDDTVFADSDATVTRAITTGENPSGDFVNDKVSGVSAQNNTTTLLGADETFVGGWEEVDMYSSISVIINSDQNSATNGAKAEFSNDGSTVIRQLDSTFIGNPNGAYFSVPVEAKYFRINYTNGPTPQIRFYVQTIFGKNPVGLSSIPVSAQIDDLTSTIITRSINAGKTPNGDYINERVSGIVESAGTTIPLGEEEEYDSGWVEVSRYSTAGLTVFSDVDSDFEGLKVEASTDGINADSNDTYTYNAGTFGKVYSIPLFSKFMRVKYKNGRDAQNEFRLQIKLFKETLKASSHRITDPVLEEDDSELVKAVLAGQNPENKFINIQSSGAGNLLVAIGERPSEVRNRIRVSNNVENVLISTTPTVIHTVTPGYKLWVTSVVVSALNDSTTRGRYGLYDGSTLIIPIIMPSRLSGSSPAGSSISSPPLPEPIMISESFAIAEIAGDITASVAFVGYEERIEYQNVYSTDFEGVDEYGQLGYTADLDLSNNFAWSAWIKTSNDANNKCVLGKYGSTAADRSHFMEVTANDGFFRVYLHSPGGVKDYSSTEVVNDGNWHHLAYTFADDVLRMYIDGVEITPTKNVDGTVTAIQTNMSDTKFGALPITGGETNYYIGMIDEITLFSRELTANEVGEIYNNGVPVDQETLSTSEYLVGWWRMGDNDTFPTVRDNIGISDCTLTNMIASDFVTDVPE